MSRDNGEAGYFSYTPDMTRSRSAVRWSFKNPEYVAIFFRGTKQASTGSTAGCMITGTLSSSASAKKQIVGMITKKDAVIVGGQEDASQA